MRTISEQPVRVTSSEAGSVTPRRTTMVPVATGVDSGEGEGAGGLLGTGRPLGAGDDGEAVTSATGDADGMGCGLGPDTTAMTMAAVTAATTPTTANPAEGPRDRPWTAVTGEPVGSWSAVIGAGTGPIGLRLRQAVPDGERHVRGPHCRAHDGPTVSRLAIRSEPGVAGALAQHAAHSRSKRSTGRTNTVAPPTSTSSG